MDMYIHENLQCRIKFFLSIAKVSQFVYIRTIYRPLQVSLDLHLNVVQHASKLVLLPAVSAMACTYSSPLPVVSKSFN